MDMDFFSVCVLHFTKMKELTGRMENLTTYVKCFPEKGKNPNKQLEEQPINPSDTEKRQKTPSDTTLNHITWRLNSQLRAGGM